MQENFQIALITENMVPDIVYHLYSENLDIKLQCSLAIFKCASNRVGALLLLILLLIISWINVLLSVVVDGERYGTRSAWFGAIDGDCER